MKFKKIFTYLKFILVTFSFFCFGIVPCLLFGESLVQQGGPLMLIAMICYLFFICHWFLSYLLDWEKEIDKR